MTLHPYLHIRLVGRALAFGVAMLLAAPAAWAQTDTDITAVKQQADANAQGVSSVHAQGVENTSRIGALEAQVAVLQAQVGVLQGLVATLAPQTAVDANTAAIQENTATNAAQDTAIAANTAATGGLQTALGDQGTLLNALQVQVDGINIPDVSQLETDVAALQANTSLQLDGVMTYDETENVVLFDGVNVQIVDGTGETAAGPTDPTPNGLGNLIIGYNEINEFSPTSTLKTGSHTLVVGPGHSYTNWGGVVFGRDHVVTGLYATVTGGRENEATASFASVSGGWENAASALYASVSGGQGNLATGEESSVSGGFENTASSSYASVSGGEGNVAASPYTSVSGGDGNTASASHASVSGGADNIASGEAASVSGGLDNTASGVRASVIGGWYNEASGTNASILGGDVLTNATANTVLGEGTINPAD